MTLQTWRRWQADVEREGMRFAAAPEYHVFPTRERPLTPYQAVERATRETLELVRRVAPAVVMADILTLAPALAGELEGVPVGTVIPHLDPRMPPGGAPYSCGARLPRTWVGRALWRGADPLLRHGLQLGRRQLNETRRRLGLPALERVHGGISEALALVATLPQLEYPRVWPAGTHVVGPLMWEPPAAQTALPPGDAPLVLIAPSTSQDPGQTLLRAALEGLAGLPVRVLASANRRIPDDIVVPPNARLVEWVSYARTMPACELVVCHGGHGTVARALSERLRRRHRAGRRRHERERRAGGLGGRRRAAAAAARRPARAGAGRRARAGAAPSCARGRTRCRRGRRATTGRRARRISSRRSRRARLRRPTRSGSCGRSACR